MFEVAEGEPVRLATSDLRLEVETSPLRLTFADAGGAWLLREPADGGMAGPIVQHTGERPMDELIVQIYPHGTSRFELYEDDGRSNAYRRGAHALTPIVCAAERGRTTVRIGAPTGDPSVVPTTRRYLLRLRLERPAGVAVEGAGELQDTTADVGRPGWWMDNEGFLGVRTPGARPITVVVTSGGSRR